MIKNFIFIVFIIIFSISVYAHKQHVHQYLTSEAYQLLKSYMDGDIPEINTHLDNGPVGPPWESGTINAGAWREDEEDIVYGYYKLIPADPGWLISISHFWDADQGDYSQNCFDIDCSIFSGRIGPYPNAYEKIMHLAFGDYILYFKDFFPYIRVQKLNGDWLDLIHAPNSIALSYYSLVDLFKNKKLSTQMVGSYQMYNETTGEYEYYYGDVYISDDFRDKIVWEV